MVPAFVEEDESKESEQDPVDDSKENSLEARSQSNAEAGQAREAANSSTDASDERSRDSYELAEDDPAAAPAQSDIPKVGASGSRESADAELDELTLMPLEDDSQPARQLPIDNYLVAQQAAAADEDEGHDDGLELQIGEPIELPKYQVPSYVTDDDDDDEPPVDRSGGLRERAANAASAVVASAKSAIKDASATGPGAEAVANPSAAAAPTKTEEGTPNVPVDASQGSANAGAGTNDGAAADSSRPQFDHSGKDAEHEPLKPIKIDAPKLSNEYASESDWFKEMLAFVPDLHVIANWIVLTILMTACLLMVSWIGQMMEEGVGSQAFAFITGALILLPMSLTTLITLTVAGSNVFQHTAEGNKVMADWPAFDFIGWVSRSLFYIVPFAIAMILAVLVYFPSRSFSFGDWLVKFVAAVSVGLAYPPLLLSIIRNDSLWNVYNKDIWNSFTVCFDVWKKFYLRIGVLLLVMLVPAAILVIPGFFGAALGSACFIFLAFVFMRLIGFLSHDLDNSLAAARQSSGPNADGMDATAEPASSSTRNE